jgi:enoyl-[acyl-carrier protein] reductase I
MGPAVRSGLGLAGKNVVVLGVADESSIAWAIARAFAGQGARVHIGYQQKFFSRVRLLLREQPSIRGQRCDILDDVEVAAFFDSFRGSRIDVLAHAIAYAPVEAFTEYPSQVGEEAFFQTLRISAYSLCKVVRYAKPVMSDGASVLTLTFQGSERAEPTYGLMGVAKSALESLVRYLALELGAKKIRVNAISPGPVETVAATGILVAFLRNPEALERHRSGLFAAAVQKAGEEVPSGDEFAVAKAAWKHTEAAFAQRSAIEEPVSKEDVAQCALFLGSDYSSKITGQVIHVDCGFSACVIA